MGHGLCHIKRALLSSIFFFLSLYYIWKAETEPNLLLTDLLPKMPAIGMAGLDQSQEARTPSRSRPHMGGSFLNHRCYFLRVCVSRKLELKAQPGLKPGTPSSLLTDTPNVLPLFSLSWLEAEVTDHELILHVRFTSRLFSPPVYFFLLPWATYHTEFPKGKPGS